MDRAVGRERWSAVRDTEAGSSISSIVTPRRREVGEVIARGLCVIMGNWNQPESTAAAVCGSWMHTGMGQKDEVLVVIKPRTDMWGSRI